jgi:signal transduction histidine kinase
MAHEEGLDFDWAIDPALPETVLGDAMRINQVVTNLLGNAFKFTEAGQVQLRVDVAGSRGGVVDVRFSVTDSGIGIEDDQLATLFQSFTQVDTATTRKYGGAGLGLAICQELVTLMGGYLGADSTMGVGSTFRFTVPLSVEPVAD